MKQISETDYRLLLHDLPQLLDHINLRGSDIRMLNIARRLILFNRKLRRQHNKSKNNKS